MITQSDSLNTVDLGKYYAILPMGARYSLNEFCRHFNATRVEEGFSYNSGDNEHFLTVDELQHLIFEQMEQEKAA